MVVETCHSRKINTICTKRSVFSVMSRNRREKSLFSSQDGDYHDLPTYEIQEQQPYVINSIDELPAANYWITPTYPAPAPLVPSMNYNPYSTMMPQMAYMDPLGQPPPSYLPTYPYNPPMTAPMMANPPMPAPLQGLPPAGPPPAPYYQTPPNYPSYYPSYPPPAPAYPPPAPYYPPVGPSYPYYPYDDHHLPP